MTQRGPDEDKPSSSARKARRYTDDQIATLASDSTSLEDLIFRLGASRGYRPYLRARLVRLDVDTSHFNLTPNRGSNNTRRAPDAVFRLRTAREGRERAVVLRRELLTAGAPYECAECHLSEWKGELLVLHVDHIDGNHLNNVRTNLRFLCPNCHSLAPHSPAYEARRRHPKCLICNAPLGDRKATHCRACSNKLLGDQRVATGEMCKVAWPSNDELCLLVRTLGWSAAGRHLGVSGNAIKKRLTLRGVELPRSPMKTGRKPRTSS